MFGFLSDNDYVSAHHAEGSVIYFLLLEEESAALLIIFQEA
jgi:hypothetical protein